MVQIYIRLYRIRYILKTSYYGPWSILFFLCKLNWTSAVKKLIFYAQYFKKYTQLIYSFKITEKNSNVLNILT